MSMLPPEMEDELGNLTREDLAEFAKQERIKGEANLDEALAGMPYSKLLNVVRKFRDTKVASGNDAVLISALAMSGLANYGERRWAARQSKPGSEEPDGTSGT